MLRCRRCRKGIIDSTCLTMVEVTDESSAAVCSIWHVDVDMLPEWILSSVHQAQWTVGKLNCQNCGARLGGFNFINRSECPCGRDATVHLNKSRVDRDHKHYVLIVQPRRTRPEREQARLLTGDSDREHRPEFTRTTLDSLQLNCAAAMPHRSHAEASNSLTDSENTQSFSFSPLYCISHRRRCSVEDDATIRSSCFCRPAVPTVKSALESTRTVTLESTRSPVSYPSSLQFDTDGGASVDAVPCHAFVPGRTHSPLGRQLLQSAEAAQSSPETTAVHDEASVSPLFLRGSSISDSVAEQDQEVVPQASLASLASNKLCKREKNRLKSLRRKQRRRERWLHSQLRQAESSSLLDSEEEEEEEEDREGLTCAVCLEVYFSPYICQPCGHIFCELCLRIIAKNRPTNTPCPLCRTLISHTNFHKELNQSAKTCFPKVYYARKQNFQTASCAKWPLPSCQKRFRTFWGERREAAVARRRWHFAHGGFTLDALDFTDMRGWLFDIGLVIIYIHSVNWILALLFLCFLMYYFFL